MTAITEIKKRLGITWKEMAKRTGYSEKTLKNAKYQKVSNRLINAVKSLESNPLE